MASKEPKTWAGGLKASFKLEAGINADTGTVDQTMFNRESWVGLTGNFGTVQLGRTWTSFDDVAGAFNHADNSNLSVTNWVWGQFGSGYEANSPNQIKYTLPLAGGLTASMDYSFGENKTATQKSDNVISLGARYEAGPFSVGFARQHYDANTTAGIPSANYFVKSKFNLIGAAYDFGAAKLVGSWSDMKAYQYEVSAKRYQVGVSFPLNASTLYFGYAKNNEIWQGDHADGYGYMLAVTHNLSKRTKVYAGYAIRRQDVAGWRAPTVDTRVTAIGLRHAF